MSIRTLIVDDEALARARLRQLLAQHPEVEVVGECGNGPEAIAFMQDKRPDLAFLDIQMPEVSGFDVLRALPPDQWPAVIFVTAHDQYAIEAFEVEAVDYLLKPFSQARLQEALRRATRHFESRDTTALNLKLAQWLRTANSAPGSLHRIAVKNGRRTIFVKIEEVAYFESAANYIVAHTPAENHILRETLSNLEARLPASLFVRISRAVVVNVNRVKEIEADGDGQHVLVLLDGKRLEMTRGVAEIRRRLQYS